MSKNTKYPYLSNVSHNTCRYLSKFACGRPCQAASLCFLFTLKSDEVSGTYPSRCRTTRRIIPFTIPRRHKFACSDSFLPRGTLCHLACIGTSRRSLYASLQHKHGRLSDFLSPAIGNTNATHNSRQNTHPKAAPQNLAPEPYVLYTHAYILLIKD